MKWLALFLFPLALAACDSALTFLAGEGWQPSDRAFKQVTWHGSRADATALTLITARNEGEWQNMWQRVGEAPPAELPQDKMAVAVLVGQKPNPGYRVEIISAIKEAPLGRAERFVVKYVVREPLAGKDYPRTLVSPWAVRLTDATEVTPAFVEIKAKRAESK